MLENAINILSIFAIIGSLIPYWNAGYWNVQRDIGSDRVDRREAKELKNRGQDWQTPKNWVDKNEE